MKHKTSKYILDWILNHGLYGYARIILYKILKSIENLI